MKIETKYNLRQEVWALVDGVPLKCRIDRIDIVCLGYYFRTAYYLRTGKNEPCVRGEYELFPTKEELIKSFQKSDKQLK